MEDWLPLVFIIYCNVRLVSFLQPMLHPDGWSAIGFIDVAMLAIPCCYAGRRGRQSCPSRLPKIMDDAQCLRIVVIPCSGRLSLQRRRSLPRCCSPPLRCITRLNTWPWSATTLAA